MSAQCVLVLSACLAAALGGHVSVRMPYSNPAGVTYISGPGAAYSTPVFAPPQPLPTAVYHSPAPLSSALGTTTYHGNGRFAGFTGFAPVAAPATAHAALVPVTRIQAHAALLQKDVHVAKPAVKTSRFELRRPAIQKQFYDVEERVVVRPAGSALLELDQPHSKIHKGSVVSPVVPSLVATPVQPIHPIQPVHSIQNLQPISPTVLAPLSPSPAGLGGPANDDDTVVVDARTPPSGITYARNQQQPQTRSNNQVQLTSQQLDQLQLTPHQRLYIQQLLGDTPQPQPQPQPQQLVRQGNQQQLTQQQRFDIQEILGQQQQQPTFRQQLGQQQLNEQQRQDIQQIFGQQQQEQPLYRQQQSLYRHQMNAQLSPYVSSTPSPQQQPDVDTRFRTQNLQQQVARNIGSNVIAHGSTRDNQRRLIDLLTARHGITEVNGANRLDEPDNNGGLVRGKVISARLQDGSGSAEGYGEKVNTRRIVVSRPIETVEEVDVVEPVTKLHRLRVQQPAYFNTARVELQPLHTSVPVLGKAVAPLPYAPLYH